MSTPRRRNAARFARTANAPFPNPETVGFRDIGASSKDIHEARTIRDAAPNSAALRRVLGFASGNL